MDPHINEDMIYAQLKTMQCYLYGYGNNNGHTICKNICELISNNIHVFSDYNLLVNNFITAFNKSNSSSCHSTDAANICFSLILNLIDIKNLDFQTFFIIANFMPKFHKSVYDILIKIPILSEILIEKIFNSRNQAMIEFVLYSATPEQISLITSKNYNYLAENMPIYKYDPRNHRYYAADTATGSELNSKYLLELLNKKLMVSKKTISMAIMCGIHLNEIKKLIMNGHPICKDYLIAACYGRNKLVISFLLDNKIVPDTDALNALLQITNPSTFMVLQKKLFSKPYYIKDPAIKLLAEIVDLLLNYNYQLNYQDILNLTDNYIIINNIEKYNIKFDNKFIELCSEKGFYPKYAHDIKPNLTSLQKECNKSSNLAIIRNLIKAYDIKPDILCLSNACKFRNNITTLRYLVECGVEIDHTAIYNIVRSATMPSIQYITEVYYNQQEKKKKLLKPIINSDDNSDNKNPDDELKKIENNIIIVSSDDDSSDDEEKEIKPEIKPEPEKKEVIIIDTNKLSEKKIKISATKKKNNNERKIDRKNERKINRKTHRKTHRKIRY